jgi:predicted methyltransferase
MSGYIVRIFSVLRTVRRLPAFDNKYVTQKEPDRNGGDVTAAISENYLLFCLVCRGDGIILLRFKYEILQSGSEVSVTRPEHTVAT